jgi:hypothetical protein
MAVKHRKMVLVSVQPSHKHYTCLIKTGWRAEDVTTERYAGREDSVELGTTTGS